MAAVGVWEQTEPEGSAEARFYSHLIKRSAAGRSPVQRWIGSDPAGDCPGR